MSFFLICLIGILVLSSCKIKSDDSKSDVTTFDNSVKQGYAVKNLGNAKRNIPKQTKDEGAIAYPTYGKTLSLTNEQKSIILSENNLLNGKATANTGGSYDKIDKDGNLYAWNSETAKLEPVNNGDGSQRKLYKHTASINMYGGNVADTEPGVIKQITFQPRGYNSYSVTGLYAPAGEVIKIEMSEEDFNKTKGVTIHIGQALYNGQCNNIWAAKNFNRMPVILNTLLFNSTTAEYNEKTHTYTCYVGSYLGGPIYVRNTAVPVTLTISGAVNYRHFVYGLTTEEEFAELSKSSVPYFDLEVWNYGVLLSGPLSAAKNFTYEQLCEAAILWDKVTSVSTQVSKQGIVFLFDPFVAAGAAVAFPGRSSVNCPMDWMGNALNAEGIIQSGCWGNFHEYNHNFQGWGLPNGGEVTNNALNLVSYASYTNISAARTMTTSGESGLSGWNTYTVSSWALNQIKKGAYNGTEQLSIYATLIHNIGCENFVKSTGVSGVTNYYNKLCQVTGYDMTYFFKEMLNLDPGDAQVSAIKSQNLKPFIPIGCVYQTGRSISNVKGEKEDIKTMSPFRITYGEDFELGLSPYCLENGLYKSGTIVLPEGFSYKIKNISKPTSGTITKKDDYTYIYKPGKENNSGEIKVTLQITKNDNAFVVEDIDLIIELEQTHEKNKSVLERTVYKFNQEQFAKYQTAAAAYEAKYQGYNEKIEEDNVNPTQNSNTDIWVPNPTNNAFMEVSGKLYVAENADYRIALRGRHSVALYISLDGGKTYTQAANINHNTNKNDWWDSENGYYDLNGLEADSWVYFKAVLRVDYASAFIGVGWGKFEVNGTMNADGKFVDENGNFINETEARKVKIGYANGYRNSYQFPNSTFSSKYLFDKKFNYTFDNSSLNPDNGKLVSVSGYTPWAGFSIENLFDEDDSNYIHSNKGADNDITKEHPFDIVVDMGKNITATTMTIYGEKTRLYLPKDFELYVGTSTNDLRKIKTITGAEIKNNNVVVTFEKQTFRYYRLVCTATQVSNNPAGSKYIAYRSIKFSNPFTLTNGNQLALDRKDIKLTGSWQTEYTESSFGRLLKGDKKATMEFSFNGKQLAIMTKPSEKLLNITVYIDGVKVTSAFAGEDPQKKGLIFLSDLLDNKEHTIKIVCNETISLDSIIVW